MHRLKQHAALIAYPVWAGGWWWYGLNGHQEARVAAFMAALAAFFTLPLLVFAPAMAPGEVSLAPKTRAEWCSLGGCLAYVATVIVTLWLTGTRL
ncbi:hypothetical protein HY375_01510 [Candidatus Berkelbacteria bacterium]|nr:hypothetical protein [Candidatus Berkelbacteria bacterium]